MIIDKTVKFGYGDILVGYEVDLQEKFILSLTEIQPPQEIGEPVSVKRIEIIKELKIEATFGEIAELRECLLRLKHNEPDIIYFKGYKLDFTKYNSKSVDVVLDTIYKAIACFLRPLVC